MRSGFRGSGLRVSFGRTRGFRNSGMPVYLSRKIQRFGVPYRYQERTARIRRQGFYIYIYSSDFKDLLVTHEVTWSRRDRFCSDQYVLEQPEEHPTATITTKIEQLPELPDNAFDKFDFDKEDPA